MKGNAITVISKDVMILTINRNTNPLISINIKREKSDPAKEAPIRRSVPVLRFNSFSVAVSTA